MAANYPGVAVIPIPPSTDKPVMEEGVSAMALLATLLVAFVIVAMVEVWARSR